jgi:hypothetical protein
LCEQTACWRLGLRQRAAALQNLAESSKDIQSAATLFVKPLQEQDYDYDGQIKFRLPSRVAGAKFEQ